MSERDDDFELEHAFAAINGVQLHYVHAGSGPLVVFVHGMPQCWYMYRHQLRAFARDHHVVAVDLRGFNESSAPDRLYETGVLPSVEDIRVLAEHLGHDRLTLVGHDIGVAVGWSFTLHYPETVDGFVMVAGVHPALFDRTLREDEEQQRCSSHWLFLRRPGSEDLFRADGYAAFRTVFEDLPFLSADDVEFYVQSWSRPGSLEGLLLWARREGWGPPEGSTPAKGNYVPEVSRLTTDVPVLAIYGDADAFIRPACYEGLEDYASNLTVQRIEGGSHWLFEEMPEVINMHLRTFLKTIRSTRTIAGSAKP